MDKKSSVLNILVDKYEDREAKGFLKYGTTMDRGDLNINEWLNHLQEELMDATLYITKLKLEVQDAIEEAAIDIFTEEESEELSEQILSKHNPCESMSISHMYPGDIEVTINHVKK